MRKTAHPKKIFVFYDHDHDGFGAAWAAWRKYGARALYLSGKHDMTVRALRAMNIAGASVFFLDFCPSQEILEFSHKIAGHMVIIDHHKTVAARVLSFAGSVYSSRHSACVLAWKHFHPGESVPRILRHVEDIDLWKLTMPGSRELFASLSWRFEFRHWNVIAKLIENRKTRAAYIRKGKSMVAYEDETVARIAECADRVMLGGYRAFAVNWAQCFSSLLGHYLLGLDKRVHVGIVFYFVERCKRIRFSLRSDGSVDVGKLAQRFGGGGHKESAAFERDARKPLPFKLI
jgi:oligoribonuclease NrnB/cAMP/cGMP phosphodiesterase (DHH superfamily)